MRSLIRRPTGPGGHRRGVTLVEMLVVVALVVLMMVILVQIFQSATGAMSASRTTQELDVNLRQIDSIIRTDLAGVTAKMTPPNDPKNKRGYFEYYEGTFADAHGEDTDDWIAFTTKAPEGQTFSGRQYLRPSAAFPNINPYIQPITINSQVAEILYFLRNGNLYRRVFLVVPERANSITINPTATGGSYPTSIFGNLLNGNPFYVSWLGMNDISARPRGGTTTLAVPIPNDLGSLTNRENRAFRPRFANDLNPADGIPDDNNSDGIPDYYPTLYYDGVGHNPTNSIDGNPIWVPNLHINESLGYGSIQRQAQKAPQATNLYAFPFIYPGMYSVADTFRAANSLGLMHEMTPSTTGAPGVTPNHSPLDAGDDLAATIPSVNQTWWGFPTWRETMAGKSSGGGVGWTDPVVFVGRNTYLQPVGLQPTLGNVAPTSITANLLPPIYVPGTTNPPPFSDGAGSASFIAAPVLSSASPVQPLNPNPIWEDDLLLTGVRSFDVKAYDPYAPLYNVPGPYNLPGNPTNYSAGYQDLGYGAPNYLLGVPGLTANNPLPFQTLGNDPVGFGHEGRIPPITADFRPHPRRGYNIGDNSPGVNRLNRVWDSWSTDYTNAPDSDIFLHNYVTSTPSNVIATYPSFPPPYPSPLRGIQIQIRLTDPRGQRAKPITIRVDFSDKL